MVEYSLAYLQYDNPQSEAWVKFRCSMESTLLKTRTPSSSYGC